MCLSRVGTGIGPTADLNQVLRSTMAIFDYKFPFHKSRRKSGERKIYDDDDGDDDPRQIQEGTA